SLNTKLDVSTEPGQLQLQPAAQPVLAEMLAQMREQTGYLRELLDFARATAEQSRTSDELITTPIN
ncbi:hypothetical protein, partial [Delftia acidovorans]|uniref:hypothetical protein n=1 Tax=Delftia acidovorans TaxID=80866 RepID=UPI0028A9EAF8